MDVHSQLHWDVAPASMTAQSRFASLKLAAKRAWTLFDVDPFGFARVSYSQEGEDRLLLELLGFKKHGVFVDVGAYHPFRYSNTYLLYSMGWSGVNIDATPGSMAEFRKFRPRDTNVECAVADQETEKTLYLMNEGQMNTLDAQMADMFVRNRWARVTGTVTLRPRRLESILRDHLGSSGKIDFLNVDAEGMDLNVLRSNNWQTFRPRIIAIESGGESISDILAGGSYQYLSAIDYVLISGGRRTCIFRDGLDK